MIGECFFKVMQKVLSTPEDRNQSVNEALGGPAKREFNEYQRPDTENIQYLKHEMVRQEKDFHYKAKFLNEIQCFIACAVQRKATQPTQGV